MAPRNQEPDEPDELDDDEGAYVDDHHRAISLFAADYLDEDERESFVDHLMERRGYRRVHSWAPADNGQEPAQPEPPAPEPTSRTRPTSSTSSSTSGRGSRRQPYFKR